MIVQLAADVSDSVCRLNSTPEMYIQVRTMNGSSWLTSSMLAPQRARMNPHPTLKIVCRMQHGDDQQPVRGHRLAGDHHDDEQHGEGQDQLLQLDHHVGERQAARGKCSARISGRLSVITVEEVMNARWVKLNTKTPVTRNEM